MNGNGMGKYLRVLFLVVVWGIASGIGLPASGDAQTTDSEPGIISNADRALIEQGRTQLQQNKFAKAVSTLSLVISNENIPPDWLALAFFYRGIANRMANNPESAVANLVNALWLRALPQQIAAQAYFHRANAYASLGKFDEAIADFDSAQSLAPDEQRIKQARDAVEARRQSETTGSLAGPLTRSTSGAADGRNGFLTPSPYPNRPPSVVPAPANSQASAAPVATPPIARPVQPVGGVQIQLGALATRAQAQSVWAQLQEQHRDLLGRLNPTYQEVIRDGRSMTRLRAGPTANMAEARTLCAALNRRGQDCIAITR